MKKTTATLLLALLCFLPARAQGLALLFESEPGTRTAFVLDDSPNAERFDANGDGTPDLLMTREDTEGNLEAIRVIDVQTQQVLWEVQDVPQTLGLFLDGEGWEVMGFADPDGDGTREALFANDVDVVLINPRTNILSWNHGFSQPTSPVLLHAVTDLTGDGFEELIIFLPETRQVQVWSRTP